MGRGMVCWLGLVALASCAVTTQPASAAASGQVAIRNLFLADADELTAKVALENAQGMAVTGALVQLITPTRELINLSFSPDLLAYWGKLPLPVGGDYTVRARSLAFGLVERKVPLVTLAQMPDLVELTDSLGNSALSGQRLKANNAVSLSWVECPGAQSYALTVFEGTTVLYAAVLSTNSVLLESALFPKAGNFAVRVVAQAQTGDPQFDSADYSAVFEAVGTAFFFKVE